jgi:hypothetical protein
VAAAVPSHERPLFVVLPSPDAVGEALVAFLSSDEVRAFALPALWDLAQGGLDPLRALPGVRRLDLDNLPRVVSWLLEHATPAALARHAEATWAEVPDRVREYFLKRSVLATLGGIFRVGKPASSFPPPPSFVADRVHEARFEVAYRLERLPGAASPPAAPPEEASLVLYPFDPRNAEGRAEAGLEPNGPEAVLEAFAYEAGRARHRAFLESVAGPRGWRVADPDAP